MKIILTVILLIFASIGTATAQTHSLIGYWQNWRDVQAPYIPLSAIDSRYDIIEVSFAEPASVTGMKMIFTPEVGSPEAFKAEIKKLQASGKKVLISVGGADAAIDLTTSKNKSAFISSMSRIIDTYGFDGLDIDIEHGESILIKNGTIAAPTNPAMLNFIDAVRQIMATYQKTHDKKMMLTMAPETASVQGALSQFTLTYGGYLPIINALRDELDILQVQLYNSGSMNGIDGKEYEEGTEDFILAMSEAVIRGFDTKRGHFNGLPASKIAVALPACQKAADPNAYMSGAKLKKAVDYLRGTGPKPGRYALSNPGGYPDLKGLMTWSINYDAVSTCGKAYGFADNYAAVFGH